MNLKKKKKQQQQGEEIKKRRGFAPPLLFKETPKWRLFELKTATKKIGCRFFAW